MLRHRIQRKFLTVLKKIEFGLMALYIFFLFVKVNKMLINFLNEKIESLFYVKTETM